MPSTLGLPCRSHSTVIHVNAAVAVQMWVTAIAIPATPSAASLAAGVKPNQPTHSIDAPTTVRTRLFGAIGVSG